MTKKLQIVITGIVLCLTSALHAETSTLSSDKNCLAEAIYREAGGENLIGQYAVAKVIMNRVHAGIAESPCAVIHQHSGSHWQFGFNKIGKKSIPSARLEYFLSVADRVLNETDGLTFPANVLYFNNIPFKSTKYHLYRVIGHQSFYTTKNSTYNGNVLAPLYGSHENLLHQNQMVQEEGLEQIKNDAELSMLVFNGTLVPLPSSTYLTIDKHLPINRRYCRPWTAKFLTDISKAYYYEFRKQLIVDSAVRPVSVQQRLLRFNKNAAAIDGEAASPHLTGTAVDINKRRFSNAELSWMRDYLSRENFYGSIDVEEEFRQKCFHIAVYKTYIFVPANPMINHYNIHSAKTQMNIALR